MNENKPVYITIMEIIEDNILTGVYNTHDMIISTTQISRLYSVNPTTSVRAVGNLADQGILYKKRGVGMCVAEGAKEKILSRRKNEFLNETVSYFLEEAKKLGISSEELINIIRRSKID